MNAYIQACLVQLWLWYSLLRIWWQFPSKNWEKATCSLYMYSRFVYSKDHQKSHNYTWNLYPKGEFGAYTCFHSYILKRELAYFLINFTIHFLYSFLLKIQQNERLTFHQTPNFFLYIFWFTQTVLACLITEEICHSCS